MTVAYFCFGNHDDAIHRRVDISGVFRAVLLSGGEGPFTADFRPRRSAGAAPVAPAEAPAAAHRCGRNRPCLCNCYSRRG